MAEFPSFPCFPCGHPQLPSGRKVTRPRDARALFPEFATKAARAMWVKNHQLSGATGSTSPGECNK